MIAHACIPALPKHDRVGEPIISVVSYSAQKVAGLANLASRLLPCPKAGRALGITPDT